MSILAAAWFIWPLSQLLGIAHRTLLVKFDHFKQRFSSQKLISVNLKTLSDYLLLKRIEANLPGTIYLTHASVSSIFDA